MNDLHARIARLERENRWFRRLGVACLLLAAGAALSGAVEKRMPKTVEAEVFRLVDAEGKPRGMFGLEDGEPTLSLTDSKQRMVVQLQVPKVPDKPALYFRDPQEQSGLELAMTMNGPVLHFTDKSGTRVRLATNELNAPLSAVYGPDGRMLFHVSADGSK